VASGNPAGAGKKQQVVDKVAEKLQAQVQAKVQKSADRQLERLGALALAFGLATGLGVLTERLNSDDAEEDGAEAEDASEPAQVIGELVGLVREELALRDSPAKRLPFRLNDGVQPIVELLSGRLLRGGVEAADAGIALLGHRSPGRKRELLSSLVVELLDPRHLLLLCRVAPHQIAELLDLEARELPIARVNLAVWIFLLVENEARERRLGSGDVGAHISNDERDFVRMALRIERAFTRIVREFDEEDHRHENQGSHEASGRSSPSPPIEADVFLFPVPDHSGNLVALTF